MSIATYEFTEAFAGQLRNYALMGIKLDSHMREWQIAAEKALKHGDRDTSLYSLFQSIKHGSDEHQTWLWNAIEAWDSGEPIPEPVS